MKIPKKFNITITSAQVKRNFNMGRVFGDTEFCAFAMAIKRRFKNYRLDLDMGTENVIIKDKRYYLSKGFSMLTYERLLEGQLKSFTTTLHLEE